MSSSTHKVNIENIGKEQTLETRASVLDASRKKIISRSHALRENLNDSNSLRHLASKLRLHALNHLPHFLEEAEKNLTENGIQVHWASDGEEARKIIGELCKKADVKIISKSKSMVTEEIELNPYLESLGFEPVETDLGEFVVQISDDHPTHIVTPIIHINGKQVAQIFEKEGLGEYTEDPEILTGYARRHLRKVFREAGVGITGANFVVADTGRFVTVSNEGNLRFCANAPKLHIAITGIEKVVASEDQMAVLLNLLARSSTGQNLTVYTQFFSGPKKENEADGPEESHLIFIDNGRTNLLGGDYHEMLQCIRCGACLNVCPVYRSVTGRGYDSVYPGPMGAVFSPLLGGEESMKKYSELPKASSLCGACEEVCPVAIPIPKMLLSLRDDLHGKVPPIKGTPSFGPWSYMTSHPALWKASLSTGKTIGWGAAKILPNASLQSWLKSRDLPDWPKQSFRSLWKKRLKTVRKNH